LLAVDRQASKSTWLAAERSQLPLKVERIVVHARGRRPRDADGDLVGDDDGGPHRETGADVHEEDATGIAPSSHEYRPSGSSEHLGSVNREVVGVNTRWAGTDARIDRTNASGFGRIGIPTSSVTNKYGVD